MAKQYKTGLVITGDARGGVKAMALTRAELDKLGLSSQKTSRNFRAGTKDATTFSTALANAGHKLVLWGGGLALGNQLLGTFFRQLGEVDKIGKMSDRIGASTEALSEYQHVVELTGISLTTLTTSWQRQTRRISEAAQGTGTAKAALEELGLSADQLSRLAPEVQFEIMADALQGVAEESDKVRLAQQIWGREGVSLLQTVKGGAESIREMRKEAKEMGLSLSGEQVDSVEAFNDSVTRLNNQIKGPLLQSTTSVVTAISGSIASIQANRDLILSTLETTGSIAATAAAGVSVYKVAVVAATAQTGVFTGILATTTAGVRTFILSLAISPLTAFTTSLYGTSVAATAATGALGKLKVAGGVLFAAFAGWQIGSWLRDNFVEARIAGAAFVGALLKGWESVKFGFSVAVAGINFSWNSALDLMKTAFAEYLSAVATGLSYVPGMGDTAEGMKAYADALISGADAQAIFNQAMAKARGEYNGATAGIDAIITDMVAYELAMEDAGKTTKQVVQEIATAPGNLKSGEIHQAGQDFGTQFVAGAVEQLGQLPRHLQTIVDDLSLEEAISADLDELIGNNTDLFGDQFKKATEDTDNFTGSLDRAAGAFRGLVNEGSDLEKTLDVASTVASTIAQLKSLQIEQAITAVLNQGNGDWFSAPYRMAAMAAFVATLGVAVGGGFSGGGGGNSAVQSELAAGSGKGTVLGDADAQSESILKASEATAAAAEQLVGINTQMLQALTGLQAGIAGAANRVTRAGLPEFATPGVLETNNLFENLFNAFSYGTLGFVGEFIDGIVGGKSELRQQGVRIVGGTFTEILDEATIQAFSVFRIKKNLFSSSKTRLFTEDLEGEIVTQFGAVFASIGDVVSSGAATLGLSVDQITEAFGRIRIDPAARDLKGLTGEEQQEALSAYFSSILDQVAVGVLDFLPEFQRAGEGAGETMARLATVIQITDEVAFRIGTTFDKLSPAINEGDIALLKYRETFIDVSGGIDELVSNLNTFTSEFYSESEQFDLLTSDFTRSLEQINTGLPASREGFRALVEGIDLTSEANARYHAQLLNLVPLADQYFDALESRQIQVIQSDPARVRSLNIQIAELQGEAEEALRLTREAALIGLSEEETALQKRIFALQDEATVLNEATVAANDLIAAEESLADKRASLEVRLARAQGNETLATQLSRQIELAGTDPELQGLLKDLFAAEDLTAQRDILYNAELDRINTTHTTRMDGLTAEIDAARSGYSAIQSMISSLSGAISAVSSADPSASRVSAQAELQRLVDRGGLPGEAQLSGLLSTLTADSSGLFGSELDYLRDRGRTRANLSTLQDRAGNRLNSASRTISTLQTAMQREEANFQAQTEQLQQFFEDQTQSLALLSKDDLNQQTQALEQSIANGDYLSDVVSIQSRSHEVMREMKEEIVRLRSDVARLQTVISEGQFAIAANTQKTASRLSKWDVEGLPEAPAA